MGNVSRTRKGDDVLRKTARVPRYRHGFAAELLSKTKALRNPVAVCLAEVEGPPRLDVQGGKRCAQPVRHAFGVANKTGGSRIFANADQDAISCTPRTRDCVGLHMREQL